jgi:hypothetical protein
MSPITIEVDIEHGKLTARQPHLLPETGTGCLTILPSGVAGASPRRRVAIPLVRCEPETLLNPTTEELDDTLWD